MIKFWFKTVTTKKKSENLILLSCLRILNVIILTLTMTHFIKGSYLIFIWNLMIIYRISKHNLYYECLYWLISYLYTLSQCLRFQYRNCCYSGWIRSVTDKIYFYIMNRKKKIFFNISLVLGSIVSIISSFILLSLNSVQFLCDYKSGLNFQDALTSSYSLIPYLCTFFIDLYILYYNLTIRQHFFRLRKCWSQSKSKRMKKLILLFLIQLGFYNIFTVIFTVEYFFHDILEWLFLNCLMVVNLFIVLSFENHMELIVKLFHNIFLDIEKKNYPNMNQNLTMTSQIVYQFRSIFGLLDMILLFEYIMSTIVQCFIILFVAKSSLATFLFINAIFYSLFMIFYFIFRPSEFYDTVRI